MKPIIDPRDGDIEDDASSTKRRSLLSLAGSLLVEISLPKLAVAWTLLIGLPGIILGIAPLLLSLWIGTVSWKASIILTGIWPVVLLSALGVLAWFAGLPLARLIESMEINTRTYSLSIEQHSDGYLAYFPALEGYNTWGKTYEEAIKHVEETLTLCFESFDDSANRPRKSEVSNNPPPSVTVRIPLIA